MHALCSARTPWPPHRVKALQPFQGGGEGGMMDGREGGRGFSWRWREQGWVGVFFGVSCKFEFSLVSRVRSSLTCRVSSDSTRQKS